MDFCSKKSLTDMFSGMSLPPGPPLYIKFEVRKQMDGHVNHPWETLPMWSSSPQPFKVPAADCGLRSDRGRTNRVLFLAERFHSPFHGAVKVNPTILKVNH